MFLRRWEGKRRCRFLTFVFKETNNSQFLLKVVVRIVLMPVIASLSYELQKYSSCHLNNPLIKLISLPGLALQKITTREPDLDELEVAIVAIKASLGQEVNNATEVFE